ncbi:MAG TPA: nucleotide exchange factor GrpE, partial [bacterium]|nr:nucleotide exchange factor GrpE [bacterium]
MEENKKNNEAKVDTDNNNNNSIETKTEPQENMVSTETAHTEKTVEIQQEEKKTSEADYEKLQKDYNDLKEILSRTVADTENFKKRKEKEVSELKKYAIENFVVELL